MWLEMRPGSTNVCDDIDRELMDQLYLVSKCTFLSFVITFPTSILSLFLPMNSLLPLGGQEWSM